MQFKSISVLNLQSVHLDGRVKQNETKNNKKSMDKDKLSIKNKNMLNLVHAYGGFFNFGTVRRFN